MISHDSHDPAMPICVVINERVNDDLGIGHPCDIFWRIPRDHTGRLRHALTATLSGCGLDRGTGGHDHGDDSPNMPTLPPSVAIWRGAEDTLTIGLTDDIHHPVSTNHTEALRHAIIVALRARTTTPERDLAPPWPTTGPAPNISTPITDSLPADASCRLGQ